MMNIYFELNEAQYTEECDTSCWCDDAGNHDGWCDSSCSVDCVNAIQDACKSFESVYNQTFHYALQAFDESNGSYSAFQQLINDTLFPYFQQKHNECKSISSVEDYQHCISFSIILALHLSLLLT